MSKRKTPAKAPAKARAKPPAQKSAKADAHDALQVSAVSHEANALSGEAEDVRLEAAELAAQTKDWERQIEKCGVYDVADFTKDVERQESYVKKSNDQTRAWTDKMQDLDLGDF